MSSPALGGALFDLDGTLLDTSGDFIHVLGEMLAADGRAPCADADVRAAIPGGSWALVAAAFDMERGGERFETLRLELLRRYGETLGERAEFYPGVEDLLRTLTEAEAPWGVVTNKPQRFAAPLMAKLGMGDATLICPEDVGSSKPAPDGVLEACRRMRLQPSRCVFIGDDLRDVQAGRDAGTRTGAALWGFGADGAEDWGADWIWRTPQQAHDQIRDLLKR